MRIRQNKSNKFLFFFFLSLILVIVFFLANITPGLKGSLDQELRIFFKQNERIINPSIKISAQNLIQSIKFFS